jgi:hypothetical protein
MRLPTPARTRPSSIFALALASVLLVACVGESTGPSAPSALPAHPSSQFAVVDANKALSGVSDGSYTFTFDPHKDQKFFFGPNFVTIPHDAVCEMNGSSGYGEAYWNKNCALEKDSVTINVVIRNAASEHPGIEFYPAMRFNPAKQVILSIYAQNPTLQDAQALTMLYCGETGACIDESTTDSQLVTKIDTGKHLVFRRIKHFSGYVVWSLASEEY